jgi:hypothetical protein
MNPVLVIVSIIGALVVIAGFVTAVWVSARAGGQAERIKRLSGDRDDYKSRVEFIEPRLVKIEQENALLQELHNPSARLGAIKADTARILSILKDQAADIKAIRTGGKP